MEPNLQPAFTFTSRQDWNNLALGLDSVIKTQLVTSHAKTPFDINLETAFYPNNVLPPPNELEVLDVKTVLPICPPIYVQPSIAQGLQAVAIDDFAATQITQLLSANNALKRGNYPAAEYLLKRPLSAEEIQNKTVTPQVRQSQNGTNYAVGPRAGTQSVTGQAYASQEKRFGDLDVRFRKMAAKAGIDAAIIESTAQMYSADKPNPRSSSEATATAWNQTIDAVEQAIKNIGVAGDKHVKNSSISNSASANLSEREERKKNNGKVNRGQPSEAKQREQKEEYPGFNEDYDPNVNHRQARDIIDKYLDKRAVPNNSFNNSTGEMLAQAGITQDQLHSPTFLQNLNAQQLRNYGLHSLDETSTNSSIAHSIRNHLQSRVDVEETEANQREMKYDDNAEPSVSMDGDGEWQRNNPGATPPSAVDPSSNGLNAGYNQPYVPNGPNPNVSATQSAQASSLGVPHAAPLAYGISLGPNIPLAALPSVSDMDLERKVNADGTDAQPAASAQLPAGITDILPSFSRNAGTTITAATVPQATNRVLDAQIASRNLGTQPTQALSGVVATGVANAPRPESQRIVPESYDRAAAEILSVPAGSKAPRGQRHFRIQAPEHKEPDLVRSPAPKRNNEVLFEPGEDDVLALEQEVKDIQAEMEVVTMGLKRNHRSDALHRRMNKLQDELEDVYNEIERKQLGRRQRHDISTYDRDDDQPGKSPFFHPPGHPDRRGQGIHGGDIGGGAIHRNPKRRRLNEKSGTMGTIKIAGPGPNITGIDGFYGSTAPITSRLMHLSGRDAVPYSGQIQVNENHQFTEPSVRQFIRQPDVVEDLVAEYEPIAVNTSNRVQRPKVSSVFERGHYGKFLLNHIALEGKRTFSVSYPKTKKKVRGMPNKLLSDNQYAAVKKVLGGGIISANDKLTKEERTWMAETHRKCGIPMHPGLMTKVKSGGADLVPGDSLTSLKRGSGALANVDPKQKIMDILGEMDAGNDNPALKRQLASVANMLFRRHQITPKLYSDCKQHWT